MRETYRVYHGHAGIDIGDELSFSLGSVCAFAEENDLGLLRGEGGKGSGGQIGAGREMAGYAKYGA